MCIYFCVARPEPDKQLPIGWAVFILQKEKIFKKLPLSLVFNRTSR